MLSPEILRARARHHFPDEDWTHPPEPLGGGLLNQVVRLRGNRRSVVAKHAPPHVAADPDIPLSSERIRFEAEALALLGAGGTLHPVTGDVAPPSRLAHDADLALLFLDDLGPGPDLATAALSPVAAGDTGTRLGRFIARLHAQTAGDTRLAERFDNRPVRDTRADVQYYPAHRYAAEAGADAATVRAINANATDLAHYLAAPGRCLTMGDLWPPSVLLRREYLRLIDWEFAHYGHPLQDVAHFLAHCHMLARRPPSPDNPAPANARRMGRAFATAYRRTLGPAADRLWDTGARRMAALHFGAECLIRSAGPFFEKNYFPAPDHPATLRTRDEAIRLLAESTDNDAPIPQGGI